MAACMMRTASLSSLTEPMCQPPRQMIGTRTPVRPSGRVGRPDLASAASVAAANPTAAPAAREDCRNSRRVLSGAAMTHLTGKTGDSPGSVQAVCRPSGGHALGGQALAGLGEHGDGHLVGVVAGLQPHQRLAVLVAELLDLAEA